MKSKFTTACILFPILFVIFIILIQPWIRPIPTCHAISQLQNCKKELVEKNDLINSLRRERNTCQEDLAITLQEIESKELYDKVVEIIKVHNGQN